MRHIRMPSHGTVAAYAALFIALGGTAYALERGSVTSRELARGAVKSSHIKTGKVKRSEIHARAVGPSEIRTDAVRSPEIRDGSVRAPEIASDAVGQSEIDEGAVGADQLVDESVGTAKLFDGSVTASKLAANAVTAASVADGSLALADLAADVASATFDPPVMSAGDCASDNSLAVTNKQAGDTVLVLPGTEGAGWHEDLTLDAYASAGSGGANTISVVLCRQFGGGVVDPGPQPLTVLLFR